LPNVEAEQTTQLTSLLLAEPTTMVTSSIVRKEGVPGDVSQYELRDIAARKRLIGTFSANVGSATTTTSLSVNDGIDDYPLNYYADQFAYVRWEEIEITITMKSNPFQYGFVLFVYVPFSRATAQSTPTFWDAESFTNYDPVIVDLTSQDEVVMKIPWHYPTKVAATLYSGATTYTNAWGENCGRLWMIVPDALDTSDSTATDAVVFSVYSSLRGLQYSGPRVDSSTVLREKSVRRLQRIIDVEGQSDPFASFTEHATGLLGGMAQKAFTEQAVKEGIGALKSWWNGGSSTIKESGNREIKFETFNNDAVMGAQTPTKSLADCKESQPKSLDTDRHSFQELIMKPSMLTHGVLLAADSTPHYVICHPRWPHAYGVTLGSTLTPTQMINCMGSGYMSYMSQFFRFYRGGIKYKFLFTCNAMISAKVRISFGFGTQSGMTLTSYSANIPTQVITVKGMCSTEFTIPTCILYEWLGMNSQFVDSVPTIAFRTEGTISSVGDRTATVMYQVWWAAAEDFEFRDLCTTGWVEPYETPPFAEGQMKIWDEFQKSFPDFAGTRRDNYQTRTDQPKYVEDLLTRWSLAQPHQADSTSTFFVGLSQNDAYNQETDRFDRVHSLGYLYDVVNDCGLFDAVGQLYMFNSGDVDWKISIAPNYTLTTDSLCVGKVSVDQMTGIFRMFPDQEHPDVGTVQIDPSQWKIIDVSTPFVAAIPWDTWVPDTSTSITKFNTAQEFGQSWATVPQTVWKKAGTDFRLSLLLPMPRKLYWPVMIHYKELPVAEPRTVKQRPLNKAQLKESRRNLVYSG
jgi:hypothetical protein